MNWHDHSEWKYGEHSYLSPSKKTWVNYDDETLVKNYKTFMTATVLGTAVHDLASRFINKRYKLLKSDWNIIAFELEDVYDIPKYAINKELIFENLRLFVNDCISNNMRSEEKLIYTPHAFGTADAIQLTGNTLLIFDLKTGATPASLDQLISYAALFCLEYTIKPSTLNYDLRIYQFNSIVTDPNITSDIIEARVQEYVHKDKILLQIDGGKL